jgi:hypothetical protein
MARWLDRTRSNHKEGSGLTLSTDLTVSIHRSSDLHDIRHTPTSVSTTADADSPSALNDRDEIRHTLALVDACRAWRRRNAELLTEDDRRSGHDPGGFCAEHRRCLSYPEQKRGACSWCVPVDPEREPEYWASHWRRFNERR